MFWSKEPRFITSRLTMIIAVLLQNSILDEDNKYGNICECKMCKGNKTPT